jgi:hypothetical protein
MRIGRPRLAGERSLAKEQFGGDRDGEKQHERDAEDAEKGKHVQELHCEGRNRVAETIHYGS